jgi:hypothetical protein
MSQQQDRDTARARKTWLRLRLLEALGELYGTACCRCGELVDITMQANGGHPLSPSFDHFNAISLGGPDHAANLRLAHLKCNRDHGSRLARLQARGTLAARRVRGLPAPGQEPLFDLPRRTFLVAVPAVLFAARLARPAPRVAGATTPILVRGGDGVAAITVIPDAIMHDPTVNAWAWLRPRVAEAMDAAMAGAGHGH